MDRWLAAFAVLGLAFLAFVWGASAMIWKVFPYRQIVHVEKGIEAWGKMEDESRPQHVIGDAPDATGPDPVVSFRDSGAEDLILVTGGFFYRQDICPDFGCLAMVIDRDGNVLHTWETDPATLFADVDFAGFTGRPSALNLNVQGLDIGPDGSLAVTFQGRNVYPYQVGIARFDWQGDKLWSRVDNSHHWPTVGPDGTIYAPIARIEKQQTTVAATQEPVVCKGSAMFQEGVQVLTPDGEVVRRLWLEDLVKASDMQGLAYSVRSDCDPYHVNGIALMNAAAAAQLPGTKAGDLVVSLRSSSALVVIDAVTGQIEHIVSGPMVAQHSPNVTRDGAFVVFDNLGGIDSAHGTRVLRVDPSLGQGTTLFPRDAAGPGGDLQSIAQGAVALSDDNSRMLVSETLGGRIFEVDTATGEALWQMTAISDLAPFHAAAGTPADGPAWSLMQTQGARYVSRADVARWDAAANR